MLQPGTELLLDDGRVRLSVERVAQDHAETRVLIGGPLSDSKGVNVPRAVLPISPLTDKDRRDLQFALDLGADWIALSFVQRPEDVAEARRLIAGRAAVMVKVEKPAAVDRLDEIIDLADGIMIARGDLGVEMPPEEVPGLQKRMIRAARRRQAGRGRDPDAGVDDPQPGPDPRRGVGRRDRGLRRRRRPDALGRDRGGRVPGRGRGADGSHHRPGRARPAVSQLPGCLSRRGAAHPGRRHHAGGPPGGIDDARRRHRHLHHHRVDRAARRPRAARPPHPEPDHPDHDRPSPGVGMGPSYRGVRGRSRCRRDDGARLPPRPRVVSRTLAPPS